MAWKPFLGVFLRFDTQSASNAVYHIKPPGKTNETLTCHFERLSHLEFYEKYSEIQKSD
jgi:hypothetical protein